MRKLITPTRDQVTNPERLQRFLGEVAGALTDLDNQMGRSLQVRPDLGARPDVLSGIKTGSAAVVQLGIDQIATKKSNLFASVDPTANDDNSLGYDVGSVWINGAASPDPKIFVCLRATTTAAFWQQLSSGGSGTVPDQARAFHNANQSITNSTWTTLSLNSERFDNNALHFTSSANLTGTVSKNGTTTLTGSGTSFLSELSVGQVISVPGGGATEKRVVIAIASNISLTVSTAFVNTASGQTAARLNSPLVIRKAGLYTVSGTVEFDTNTSGSRFFAIALNEFTGANTGTPITQSSAPAVAFGHRLSAATQYQFAQWDFIEMRVFQNSGGSLNILTVSNSSPELAMCEVVS